MKFDTLSRLPPLNALRAFVVAARHLSMSGAAAELHVTAAAVSQQIRQLEEHLGCPLFRRGSRGLELTDEGRSCLPRMAEAFEGMLEALSALQKRGAARPLTVSVSPSFAARWLVPRLHRFRADHPAIDVRVMASAQSAHVPSHEYDCAIRFGAGAYPGLSVEKLLTEAVFPVCSPMLLAGAHPLRHPEDVRDHTLLHDDSADEDASCPSWRMWLRAAGVSGVTAAAGLHFNQSSLVLDAAAAGYGLALAKARLADEDVARGRLVRPFEGEQRLDFAYYLVYPPNETGMPAICRHSATGCAPRQPPARSPARRRA